MSDRAELLVHLVAVTAADHDAIADAVGFLPDPDAADAEHVIEAGGRLCYESFGRPGKATARNVDYIRHILAVGHGSVLEHGVATFIVQGISRSCSHELVRHRHISPSQLSQRYVDEADALMVRPEVIDAAGMTDVFDGAVAAAKQAYRELVVGLSAHYAEQHPDWTATARRKAARQAARSVMPNATETKIQLTANFRAWRHFIAMRATEHADVEIRALAIEVLRQLQVEVPNVFGDFAISRLDDGTEVAASPYTAGAA